MRYRRTAYYYHRRTAGFALPTILIAAVIMMILLTSGLLASTAVRSSLNAQYYNQLAREAAESGASYATACLKANNLTTPWHDNGNKLRPETDCGGVNTSASNYLIDSAVLRTTFVVSDTSLANNTMRVSVKGTVELLRPSDDSIWKTYSQSLVRSISTSQLLATKSASGRYQVCGLIDGHSWCWGQNDKGQLGDGTTDDTTKPVQTVRQSGKLLGKVDTDIAVGDGNACVVSSGKLYCWGRNNTGLLGINTTDTNPHPYPVEVFGSNGLAGKTVSQVVTNGRANCALAEGDVWCWGQNDYGMLGDGKYVNSPVPVRVNVIGASRGLPVTQIVTNPMALHVCAIAAGDVYCWGRNNVGQLGDGTTTSRHDPVPVATDGAMNGETILSVALDGYSPVNPSAPAGHPDTQWRAHSCAVSTDGDVFCWGANQYGQLGQGFSSTTFQTKPLKVGGALTGKWAYQVAASYSSSCALADNAIYCWGSNDFGVIGDGTQTQRNSPTPVTLASPGLAGKTIDFLSAGVNRTCAVADAVSYCWGRNTEGQLGDGTTINRFVPTEAIFLRQSRAPMNY